MGDIVPILEYFQEPEVQEKMEEVGRIIWSNNSISINLGAVIALGLLALALLGGLLFLLFAGDGGGETAGYGYGYEQTDYGYGGDFAQRSSNTFSDVRNAMSNLLATKYANAPAEGLQAFASTYTNAANNIVNNLIN